MFHYVYKTTHIPTGRWYVGIRSCHVWPTEDSSYLGSGSTLLSLVRQEGRGAFAKQVLVIVETRAEAARIERELVGPDQVADPMCLNLCGGGDCGPRGFSHSEEARRKIQATHKGRTWTREHRLAHAAAMNRADVRERIGRRMSQLTSSPEARLSMANRARRRSAK